MEAIAYLRRSSAPTADTRTVSFEMQESAVRQLAKRNGDEIASLVTDWARSGGDSRRPGYRQLLAGIESGTIATIYSYSLSRLSRSLLDFADLLEKCKQHNVKVRLVQEGDIDWRSATGRAFAGMAAVFAQMERELATERIQSAVDARRERGDHLGQAPYGWKVVAGKLVRRDDEDPAVVLAAFHEAGSFGGAARLLNKRDVPTRRDGTAWNHGTVADIIRQQYPAEAPKARTRAKAKPRTGRTLAGLLACPCGSILTPRSFKGLLTYYCSRSYRVPGHGKTTVREADIIESVKSEAARFRVPVDVIQQAARHDERRSMLEAKRERIVESYMDGLIDKGARDRRLAAVQAEVDALQAINDAVNVPAGIDWSWRPDDINAVLHAYWHRIPLDARLAPAWPGDDSHWQLPAEYLA